MDASGIDALLVAERLNFAYLTGYQSREFEKRLRNLLFLLDRHGEGWEQMRAAVGSDGGWPSGMNRYAAALR